MSSKCKCVLIALLYTFIFLCIVAFTVLVITGFVTLYDKYPDTMSFIMIILASVLIVFVVFMIIYASIEDYY